MKSYDDKNKKERKKEEKTAFFPSPVSCPRIIDIVVKLLNIYTVVLPKGYVPGSISLDAHVLGVDFHPNDSLVAACLVNGLAHW
jgi:hypothetical protein